MNELLKYHFHSIHSRSNHKIYLFLKDDLARDNNLSKFLVASCQNIQDQIWQKKFDTKHNTIEKDILLIALDNVSNKPAAFLSSSFIQNSKTLSTLIYHSDGMILPESRNKGLLRYFFEITNKFAAQQYPSSKIINIVATGYIHIFNHFECTGLFDKIDWQHDIALCSLVENILRADFGDLKADRDGKITAGWNKQNNNMQNTWPRDMAIKFNFPLDVDYFNGDVLVRAYEFKSKGSIAGAR